MTKTIHFTLVSTIFNEASRLPQTISDLEAQTLKPSEIIITDAGSTDATWQILEDWKQQSSIPIVLLHEKGCNVARGRNLAIEAASHELIVSTDFGCRFHPSWLESITAPFNTSNTQLSEASSPQLAGGNYTVIETEINTPPAKANYLLSAGYTQQLTDSFIPSSRSIAYKKSVWKQVGGYPEWLTLAADDLVFGMKTKAQNIAIHLVHEPYVYWGRHPRRKQYAKEAFRYGLGDGEARVNFRNFVSNLLETGLRYYFVLASIIAILLAALTTCTTLTVVAIICIIPGLIGLRSYVRTFKNWMALKSKKYNFGVFMYSLLMLEEQRIAYTRGYIKGRFFATAEQKQGAAELHKLLKMSHEH